MKDKEKINSSRTILLINISKEIFKLSIYNKILINSISLSTLDSQYNYNNFEMNIQNPLEIGKSITGISRSSYNIDKKKKIKTREKEKKQSYKKPKFLYRLGITPSNIFNILSHVNDIDINKIRKRKIISEAKFKDIETPKTINTLYFNQEKIIIEKQGFNYLRELAKSLKDFEKCNRKSLKSSKTMRLSVLESNEINEKLNNVKYKTPPKIKARSNKDIINIFKPSKFKNNDNTMQRKSMEVNYYINRNKFKNNFENKSINEIKNISNEVIYEDDKEQYESKIYQKKSIKFILPEHKDKKKDNNYLIHNVNK